MRALAKNNKILIDGNEFRILSGEMHYFRIPREYWRNRLKKLKACGLNTVSTYMPWNLHERKQGRFDFSGELDVRHFIELADELGLKVILRPGPYICAEWEFGGFPAWLLAVKGLRLRCSEPQYLTFIKRYFKAIFVELRECFDKNIIMMQIENGYASYGNDVSYTEFLKELVDNSGYKNIVIVADGDSDRRISATIPDGVLRTLMCGQNSAIPQLQFNHSEQPDMPQLIIEYWAGWFLANGGYNWINNPEPIVNTLEKVLEWGAHVNLYMFHGGTNFGFMNGAMQFPGCSYVQHTTSYDFHAPLSEAGDTTWLYREFRRLFAKYNPDFDESTPIPANSKKFAYGKVELAEFAPFAENFGVLSVSATQNIVPLTMEEAGGDFGFVRYRTELKPQTFPLPVKLYEYQDRGWAFFNGKPLARFGRDEANFTVDVGSGGILDIVIENMGRTNFCYNIENNRKGIFGGVVLNEQQFQFGWETSVMPMEDTAGLKYGPLPEFPVKGNPGFFRGAFWADKVADTFLAIPSGTNGFCKINGKLLGRYEKNGPVHTLFIPASLLKKGKNSIEVFENENLDVPSVYLLDNPAGDGRILG